MYVCGAGHFETYVSDSDSVNAVANKIYTGDLAQPDSVHVYTMTSTI